MRFQTVEEYKNEIARVDAAMEATTSKYLKRDFSKYKKRLVIEMRRCAYEARQQKEQQGSGE